MASKRTLNRLYWATVKAVENGSNEALPATSVYRRALSGASDTHIVPYLEKLESKYGTHKPHTDLANSALWDARKVVDAIGTGV